MIDKNSVIHKNAKISETADIGPDVLIGPNVEIGKNVKIHSHVNISGDTVIGKGNKIYPFASIGNDPQDLKYNGEETKLVIGDNNKIREYVTIHPGTSGGGGLTKIGDNCLFMISSHIAHDCFVGNHCIFSNNSTLAGHITTGEYVILSGFVAVHQFCRIGSHSFVAGGSLVRKDVPPYVKAAREPLSYVGINSVGLRRRGFSSSKIIDIQNIYRILYQKKYNNTQALEIIAAELSPTPERDEIIQFVENSQRGIMKGYFQRS